MTERRPRLFGRRNSPAAEAPNPKGPLTLDTLPAPYLHELRLDLMRHLGRTPDQSELATFLPQWLRRREAAETTRVKELQAARKRKENEREKLDIAWLWRKGEDERLGIRRTEADLATDERVMQRMERRQRRREKERAAMISATQGPHDDDSADSSSSSTQAPPRNPPGWLKHRDTLKTKFPEGWAPPKRLSREAIELMRILHRASPDIHTTPVLAERFKTSAEAVRRILKSKFELPADEQARREAKRKAERQRERELQAAEATSAPEGERFPATLHERVKSWAGDKAGERGEMARLRQTD